MKKNKAFTLIELIAVIVILGIIAIITTSSILIILKNNRKNTFALSLENLIKSFELLNSNSSITGEYYDNIAVTSPILETSNEKFKDGELGYNSHRIPEVRYATNGEFCGAGTSGKFQVSSGNCEGLDISPAVIANITTIPSQYSIRIIITANDRESGVAKYEISTDSAIYIE
ncbi:MAG: prepilin-type N-terminal cleavage/methylation domain-containing protein, partial [Tissierellia bacterium]|nr:prepilin-type N-terminal cleavage/methylation domain-containing protein [Tissierellia bacterium]